VWGTYASVGITVSNFANNNSSLLGLRFSEQRLRRTLFSGMLPRSPTFREIVLRPSSGLKSKPTTQPARISRRTAYTAPYCSTVFQPWNVCLHRSLPDNCLYSWSTESDATVVETAALFTKCIPRDCTYQGWTSYDSWERVRPLITSIRPSKLLWKYSCDIILIYIKGKAIPVRGRGGPYGCEASRAPYFLDNRLTDS
jgi:hypothetical protein